MNSKKKEESSKEENKENVGEDQENKIETESSEQNLNSKPDEEKFLLLAEIENVKKRHLKEKSDIVKYSNQKLISRMVSLLDNYETALKASDLINDENVKKFLSGIAMAIEDFRNCLRNEGVEEYSIKINESIWDSRFCEVVDEVENEDYEEGTIVDLVRKGYLLNGRMIRPASVVISKKKS